MSYLWSYSDGSNSLRYVRQWLVLTLFCLYASAAQSQLAGQPVDTAINLHPKTPLNTSRLWLPPHHAASAGLLLAAANRALEHTDCAEVLYGGLNEFRTEREGISFTVLCIKDARTTFNQIFHESDLTAGAAPLPVDNSASQAEFDRLRNLMRTPTDQQAAPAPPEQQQPPAESAAPPTVF